MKPMQFIFGFSLIIFSGLGVSLGAAQDSSELTAAELELLFSKQKTRGLVLVPVAPVDAVDPNAPESAEVEQVITEVVPETTYIEVDRADQVNIQVSFDFDSASLRDDQKPKLATLCQVMNSMDIQLFQIVGHTDSSGSAGYNQRLSLLRAQEVKRYLVNDCGVDENRLVAIGVGESAPLDVNDTRNDINRRVEFQALG